MIPQSPPLQVQETPKAIEGNGLHDILICHPNDCIPKQVITDENVVCKNQATAGDKPELQLQGRHGRFQMEWQMVLLVQELMGLTEPKGLS